MAYIKYSCICSNGMMFFVNTGIGNRHIVSGKFSHLRAQEQYALLVKGVFFISKIEQQK